MPDDAELRDDEKTLLPAKRYLILCEGETEWVYFRGIKSNPILSRRLSAVTINIVAPSGEQDKLQDNSLKGMICEAMKRKKAADKQKNSYNEIWIVIDNDERNSYHLTSKTKDRIAQAHLLSAEEFELFASVSDRFFLSEYAYRSFLEQQFPNVLNTRAIIDLTDKSNEFSLYEDPSPEALFYEDGQFAYSKKNYAADDFDAEWKNYLLKAYTCRAFESWLVLHFERCKAAFEISKDDLISDENSFHYLNVIHYFRDGRKFIPGFCKGIGSESKNEVNAYEGLKQQPYSKSLSDARTVIERLETAIENACWLRREMWDEIIANGLKYYEVNPYTNVDYLVSSLLGKKVMAGIFKEWLEISGVCDILLAFDTQKSVLSIEIVNRHPANRIIFNSANMGDYFELIYNDAGIRSTPIKPDIFLGNTLHLLPGSSGNFAVHFPILIQEGDYCLHFFYAQDKNNVAIYPLP